MKRRDFIQMLGMGGLVAVVPAPLFGSTEGATPKLWTPGQKKDLAGRHIVLTRPSKSSEFKTMPGDTLFRSPEYTANVGGSRVALSRHGRWPILTGDVFLAPEGHFRFREQRKGEPFPLRFNTEINMGTGRHNDVGGRGGAGPVQILVPEGGDPHLAFYQGAMKMREAFKTDSAKLFQNVPGPLRSEAQIVTIVDNPIFAGPHPEDDEGFTIEADYQQYIIHGDVDPNGWDVYSEFGEFPIEVPSKIDMGLLLKIDTRVFRGDLKLPVS